MATMTREELQIAYSNGQRDFSSTDFSGLDLGGMILEGINAAHASFENCDLRYASLKNSELYRVNFNSCDCYNTDFTYTDLYQACFYNANLHDASFYQANLMNTNFENAKSLSTVDHTLIASLLFQTIDDNPIKRAIAGTIFISKDMCWWSLGNLFIGNSAFDTPEIRQWIRDTFAPYEELSAKYEYILERFSR